VVDPSIGHLVPVPNGPVRQITTELSYAAFPLTVPLPGGYLMSYKAAATHNSPGGYLMHRRSPDGIDWGSAYFQTGGMSPSYSWGHGGVAVETAAQGGRVHLLLLRLHFTSATVDEVRSWHKWSDDGGVTWQLGVQMPTITGIGWYPSSLIVCDDGSLLAAGYNSDGWVRFLRSTDRGATWVNAGAVTDAAPDRGLAEGTVLQLSTGQVLSFQRSDTPTPRLSSSICDDITAPTPVWSTPAVAVPEGSGLPNAIELPGGHIALGYRGYSDRSNPAAGRPLRIAMFTITPTGIVGYRDGIDPMIGEDGRMLYGNPVLVDAGGPDEGWALIYGLEGPGGQGGGSAAVVAIPVEWRTV
jgi:hypothetical protein